MTTYTIAGGTSGYTSSPSLIGQKNLTGLSDALFLKVSGDMVLQAWEQVGVFKDFVTTKTIPYGKQATFPIIGRKRDAAYHTPGDLVVGGNIEHSEVVINVDGVLFDSVFVAEIDELRNHYDVHAAYMRQLGESLALKFDAYASQLMAIGARNTTPALHQRPDRQSPQEPRSPDGQRQAR